ncbi:glycosyltransferase [Arcobacter vandammei]|uniref:glycosyltransferase n=1 Tax=Arcobacter vandammei TaxID=2782243 RepID=UPI0018DF49B7|nr:glycosyltransferase [Arcobacter vandammei]
MLENKIKVLVQLNQLGYGGTEKAIYTFLKNSNTKKFIFYIYVNSDIYSLNYWRIKALKLFCKKYEIKFKEKYETSFARWNDFSEILEDKIFVGNGFDGFIKIIEKIKPDVIHFNRGVFNDFYTTRIDEIPNAIKLVETNIFGIDSNISYLERLSSIFFVSKWLRDEAKWSIKYNSKILYNPINRRITNETLHEKFNIPKDDIVLGRISRPNLDDGEFIFNILEKTLDKNIWFISIGASENFIKLTKNNPKIINLSPTVDTIYIDQFYNTLDILLHFRIEGETFGMNIAEAMIHGKPVISHISKKDNAQYELLISYKECGFVINLDIDEYVNKLKILIEDLEIRDRFSRNAEIVATSLFSEEKVTSILEKYYQDLFTN